MFKFEHFKRPIEETDLRLTRLDYFASEWVMLKLLAEHLVCGYMIRAQHSIRGGFTALDVVSFDGELEKRARFTARTDVVEFVLKPIVMSHKFAADEDEGLVIVKVYLMHYCGVLKDEFCIGLHLKLEQLVAALELVRETGLGLSSVVKEVAVGSELVAGL